MTASHLLAGRKGERLACRHLLREGFDILARRWRGRSGELDIVAFERDPEGVGELLVFVEVKMRSSARYGDPWEFVDARKQQILQRTATEFIAACDMGRYAYRFDIVSVIGREVTLYRNAF